MSIMGPFFSDKGSDIVVCKKCGSVYVDIDVDQQAFTNYYSSDYSKSLSYIEVFGKENAEIYYTNIEKRISKYVDKKAAILEVGGGIGELASFLKSKGYDDITVMEPSERCIKLCEEKGLKTVLSDGMGIDKSLEEKFDFIIINHTLEHVLNFGDMMKNAREMLKPGGGVYIEVPDTDMYCAVDFVPYWFFTYEHVVHFNLESFENLAVAFDLFVAEKESYYKCNSYHVMYAIMRKRDIRSKEPIKFISGIEKSINQYINKCETELKPVIQKLEKMKEPLVLWGIGSSTAQLLNRNFDNCNVIKLVDSNPYRQKVRYRVAGKDLKIEDPRTVYNNKEAIIVILPLMYDASIRKQIKDMGLTNSIQSLIDEV